MKFRTPLPGTRIFWGARGAGKRDGGVPIKPWNHCRSMRCLAVSEIVGFRMYPQPDHDIFQHVEPAFGMRQQDPGRHLQILHPALGEGARGKRQHIVRSGD